MYFRCYGVCRSKISTWTHSIKLVRYQSTNAYPEYLKALLKKFIFQVHPDYFYNFKSIQEINSKNLRILSSIINDHAQKSKVDARTLTFYLKPTEDQRPPNKVKLSLHRIAESMTEILETLGIEVPEKPIIATSSRSSSTEGSNYGFNSYYKRIILEDEEAKLVAEFLDSLWERREIIALREEREVVLRETEKALLKLTELASVEYWNTWSAQNNALLLNRIIEYIEAQPQKVSLPWTGLRLVLAKDDCAMSPVDYIERCIRIDCSDVPSEWMHTLTTINPKRLQIMNDIRDKLALLERNFSMLARHHLRHAIAAAGSQHRQEVVVKVRKGFTCSERQYGQLLVALDEFKSVLPCLPPTDSATEEEEASSAQVDRMAVVVELVVEEGHGSRLLPSGQIRLDARLAATEVLSLLQASALESVRLTAQHQHVFADTEALRRQLKHALRLRELGKAVGVDDTKFAEALRSIDSYLQRQNNDRYYQDKGTAELRLGVFRHMQGLRLVVGHYTGLRDDGAVLLPWSISFHSIN